MRSTCSKQHSEEWVPFFLEGIFDSDPMILAIILYC